ncbi:translesion DNA synthesis-associated protein ImuA [Paraburkholderia sp. CNPSo 3274]|uniref:translesion DNA synthesis-associated protein ImuA n=1 Tax=Paraburkholderia sp. CNPSo 3274 TaxID=2940932 RepID=UPI0020B88B25|nr:translesion DNA synthesis-associated protein ImuA [Paraburkholderia sp. CNPSo 3274]MCP3706622.1 translesion DNA synthesis-associated protein ImuA [Paraburkholderia sp. CNPSo 3274]
MAAAAQITAQTTAQLAAHLPPRLQSRVWQGDQLARASERTVPSGHATLDAQLPGAGWPSGSLTELLVEQGGVGEMRLVAPALRALTVQAGRHVLLVAPPWRPYACALKAWGLALERVIWVRAAEDEAAWVAEQALKQEGMGAVLLWQTKARPDAVRRLQVAAQDSQALAFLVRPLAARNQSSPAPLRMTCSPVPPPDDANLNRRQWMQLSALSVDIFKRRGPPPAQPLVITLPLQDAVLPQPDAASVVMPLPGVNHAVDRRHLAVVAAGGRQTSDAAGAVNAAPA